MISPEELQQSLKHFTSTDNYYRHLLSIRHTDGIQYLAQEAQCYWLIDVIASHQTKKLLADQMLKDFQLWLLVVGDSHEFIKPKPHHQAVVTCWGDTPDPEITPYIRQDIEFTDFPLPEIKLFLVQGVLMLPGEY
ncbi:MAG: hypothetical protein HEQ13_27995 [Dolichospermum sp. DEX189]|jgi:hypothetical protein|nr:hypothetical protein [Dolichospermum sp. DEX189]MDK2407988.1 hypothetical protein [Aphanizomenon sp. 202]MDK2458475.1 hypothetical protein [Aphanizomenon sp. PH219]OBQ39801.1 MAG: hypothetical protein AN485_05520 [Anabaena sp. MDT14b]